MAMATLLSRIGGLVRDVLVARLFGAGLATDAFFVAFTIPNLLRRFFAEGSLSAAFVPTFSEVLHQRGEEEAQRLANRCMTLLLLVHGRHRYLGDYWLSLDYQRDWLRFF